MEEIASCDWRKRDDDNTGQKMYRVRERLRKKKRKAKPMKDWILEKKGEKRERAGSTKMQDGERILAEVNLYGMYGYVKGNMRVYIRYSMLQEKEIGS